MLGKNDRGRGLRRKEEQQAKKSENLAVTRKANYLARGNLQMAFDVISAKDTSELQFDTHHTRVAMRSLDFRLSDFSFSF